MARTQQAPAPSPAEQFTQAVAAAQHGEPARALALADALLHAHPDYEPALKLEGALLEDAGRQDAAQRAFEHALRLAPEDPELLFAVGVADLRRGETARARDLLEHGSRLSPDDSQMFFYLAQAEHLTGHEEAGLAAGKRAVELEPANPEMQQKYGELLSASGNTAEAQTSLLKARTADPSLPRIDFDLGVAALRNEDLDAAASYAAAAATRQPGDPAVLKLTAEVAVKLGRWAEAQAAFQALLAQNPHDSAARLELGHCQLAQKQYAEAASTLEQVVHDDPTTILAHFYLARIYAAMGKKAEAEHEIELHNRLVASAGSVVPQDQRAVEQATLLQARQLLLDGKEADALRLFRERSKGPTATPGAPYMLVGVSYLYMGHSAEAERCLKQALAMDPTVHDAHTYLGLLALQRGDLPGAEAQFNAELAQDPNSQLATAELGEVRYRQGRWQDAADQIARSHPVQPALLYMLSDAQFHLGHTREADLAAELAIDYGRGDPANVARVTQLLREHGENALAAKLVPNP